MWPYSEIGIFSLGFRCKIILDIESALSPMTGVLTRNGHRGINRDFHLSTRYRLGLYCHKSRIPRATRSWKRYEQILPKTFRGSIGPVHTGLPELSENKFLLFKIAKFMIICYSHPGKLIHHFSAFMLYFFTCAILYSCVLFYVFFLSQCITFKIYKILQNIKVLSDFKTQNVENVEYFLSLFFFVYVSIALPLYMSHFFHIKLG